MNTSNHKMTTSLIINILNLNITLTCGWSRDKKYNKYMQELPLMEYSGPMPLASDFQTQATK